MRAGPCKEWHKATHHRRRTEISPCSRADTERLRFGIQLETAKVVIAESPSLCTIRAMTLTMLLIPTYQHMLQTLSGLLDKAEQQMPDRAEALLAAQLATDMFPLAAQIRFAVFQAQEAVFRLRGECVPEWLDAIAAEGRNASDACGTIADARRRIDEALSFLTDVFDDALDAGRDLQIAIDLPGGIAFDMTGEQYARDWALPQFYFHVMTAYSILRNQGVEIGKANYVPHMFAYLRPETIAN
jgi:uncharacterized protein